MGIGAALISFCRQKCVSKGLEGTQKEEVSMGTFSVDRERR